MWRCGFVLWRLSRIGCLSQVLPVDDFGLQTTDVPLTIGQNSYKADGL
jgi:hypothetical protein